MVLVLCMLCACCMHVCVHVMRMFMHVLCMPFMHVVCMLCMFMHVTMHVVCMLP